MREFAINTGRVISGQAVASDACSPNPRTFLRSDGAHLPTRSTTARADATAANGSSFREQFERGQPTWSFFTAERIHRPPVSFASQDAAHVAMTTATLHDVRERLHRVACVRRGIRRFVRRERANKRTNDRPTSNHFLRPLRGSSFLPSLLPRGWPKINEGDCERSTTRFFPCRFDGHLLLTERTTIHRARAAEPCVARKDGASVLAIALESARTTDPCDAEIVAPRGTTPADEDTGRFLGLRSSRHDVLDVYEGNTTQSRKEHRSDTHRATVHRVLNT